MTDKRDKQRLEGELTWLQPVADPDFEHRLKQEMLNAYSSRRLERRQQTQFSFGRWVAVAAVGLLAIILLTPVGRAMAQQILRLGVFNVTTDPSIAERVVSEPSQLEPGSPSMTVRVDPSEASARAGFEVYYPDYLPAGYQPLSNPPLELLIGNDGEIRAAEVMFAENLSGELLFFSQHLFPPDEEISVRDFPVGETAVELVTVGSSAGLWLPDHPWGSRFDENGTPVVVPYNVLIWIRPAEEGSYYFWLGSQERLQRDEMLKIANSIVVR